MNIIIDQTEAEAFRYGSDNEPHWFISLIGHNVIIFFYGYCTINYFCNQLKANIGDWIIRSSTGNIKIMKNKDFKLEYL